MGTCAAVAARGRRCISTAPVAAAGPRVPSAVRTNAMVLIAASSPLMVSPRVAFCVQGCVSRRSVGGRAPCCPVLLGRCSSWGRGR